MKLLTVLMLIALPLSCLAGSGCSLLEQVVSETIDKNVTAEQYVLDFHEFLDSEDKENVAKELKNCFLGQDDYTLANVKDFVEIVYSSPQCSGY